jgi:hypothetical protein
MAIESASALLCQIATFTRQKNTSLQNFANPGALKMADRAFLLQTERDRRGRIGALRA